MHTMLIALLVVLLASACGRKSGAPPPAVPLDLAVQAVTRELLATAVEVLRQTDNAGAAERADGAIHLSSHGLYQDYDSWITAVLPKQVQGQSYCHLATVEFLLAADALRLKNSGALCPL